ncbi:MAG: hypothetical protein II230_00875 [Clostridia bacterium]|nr:hypothetical protein [Clostridia bacterium]
MEYKIELLKLGKTQVDLINEINSRDLGFKSSVQDMSYALKGTSRPKYDKIRAASENIINEWKAAASP